MSVADDVISRPVRNNGSSPIPDRDRLAPFKLKCPPVAEAFSDIAIVPSPPISTTHSTSRPSVSSRALGPNRASRCFLLCLGSFDDVWSPLLQTQLTVSPPSTTSSVPVTYLASSDPRNSAA